MAAKRTIKPVSCVLAMVAAVGLDASAAQAQTAYDITLRSIAPSSISAASFDGRSRQTVMSIGPASLENSPSIVPAVYDPALKRFVSAIGSSRGAIAVNSTGAVSVVVNNQPSNLQVASGSTGIPLRSEPVARASSVVTTQQISTISSTTAR